VSSVFSSGREIFDLTPIHMVVDGNDQQYLREYADHPSFQIHRLTDTEFVEQAQRTIHTRFCLNYCRCLSLSGPRGIVILEDDVLVRPNFMVCLEQAVEEIEKHSDLRRYVLSLHSKRNLPANAANHRGQFYVRYPPIQYYGTQGMYYPQAVVGEIRDYLCAHGVENYRQPGDMLIRELMRKRQMLYNTAWDLVEHIGEVSTGLGKGRAWRSATFRQPWVPLATVARSGGSLTGG
jgi:hypothetical protein